MAQQACLPCGGLEAKREKEEEIGIPISLQENTPVTSLLTRPYFLKVQLHLK
jgi:hypothetical protein